MIQTNTPEVETSYRDSRETPRFERYSSGMPTYADVSIPDRAIVETSLTRWSAIIAGAFAAISIQVLFTVLGTAIGLSIVSATNDTPETGLSIGAGLWWLVSGLLSLFFGGWIAGRLSPTFRNTGTMHGFLTWCTVMVMSVVLVAIAGGGALGGSLSMLGNSMSSNDSTSLPSLNDVRNNRITDRDAAASFNSNSSIDDRGLTLTQAQRDARSTDRDSTASLNSNSSFDDRGLTFTQAERDTAAKHAAGASWWTLLALALGAMVASIGGLTGAYRDEHHKDRKLVRETVTADRDD